MSSPVLWPSAAQPVSAPKRLPLVRLRACPVCACTTLRRYCHVPSIHDAGEFIDYDRCGGCGVVFRNPRPDDAERLRLYADKKLNPKPAPASSRLHYAYMLRLLRRGFHGDARPRLLDFGCGSGSFLLEAAAAGFEAVGLEVNGALARHVEQVHGIPVRCGALEEGALGHETFDVIVSSMVIEHLTDPRHTLRRLVEHLRPDGRLLVEVPNLSATLERWRRGSTMDDSHLFYFDAGSLRRLFTDVALETVLVQQGLRPFRFLGERSRKTPVALLGAWERGFNALGLRTALSVIGVRRARALRVAPARGGGDRERDRALEASEVRLDPSERRPAA